MNEQKSFAKVNIFLKIVGKRDGYHLLKSRFMRVENLYDIMRFDYHDSTKFSLEGNFSCDTKDNLITKAYLHLCQSRLGNKVEKFFRYHKVKVEKNIPELSGLGGGSSNAATFLMMANKYIELFYSIEELAEIGSKLGADVPFFLYGFDSANVSGVGEVVEYFDEKPIKLNIITPKANCQTAEVYKRYSESRKDYEIDFADELLSKKSGYIIENYNCKRLNDLLEPAIELCPALSEYVNNNWFLSGSGSSFFKKG